MKINFLRSESAWLVFVLACGFYYGFFALLLGVCFGYGLNYVILFFLTLLGCLGVVAGRFFSFFEVFFQGRFKVVKVDASYFIFFIWASFLFFCAYASYTADAIPI